MPIIDVRALGADLVTVDALARLQLAAGRHGGRAWLRNASAELLELVALAGLAGVLREEPPGSTTVHNRR